MKKLDISQIILKEKYDYMFNILEIDNFNKQTSHLRNYYNFIIQNHKKLKGDLFEFGVYKGKSLIATALLLKKLKSKKKVIGFDTFSGFPSYHKYDNLKYLKNFSDVYNKHLILKKCVSFKKKMQINKKNISTSNDFSDVSIKELKDKIKFLKLKNIILVKGNFNKTIPQYIKNIKQIFAANIDSDLYESYKIVLSNLYPRLVKGGMIHLDEYFSLKFPGARIATNQFVSENNLKLKKIKNFDWEFDRYFVQK
jgi:hypothetical protein